MASSVHSFLHDAGADYYDADYDDGEEGE